MLCLVTGLGTENDARLGRQDSRDASRDESPRAAVHFGLRVRRGAKHGLRLERDSYAQINKRSSLHWPRELCPELWDELTDSYEDVEHLIHTDAWGLEHQEQAMLNYDLNMEYFAFLDPLEFDQAVNQSVAELRGMREVTDLREWDRKSGLYVMVLDDFRQVYVGVAQGRDGVMGRIKRHWNSSTAFDRLLFGDVNSSRLSIDSFRALGTTRIFARKL